MQARIERMNRQKQRKGAINTFVPGEENQEKVRTVIKTVDNLSFDGASKLAGQELKAQIAKIGNSQIRKSLNSIVGEGQKQIKKVLSNNNIGRGQNIVDFVGKQVLEVADMKDFSQKSFQKKFNDQLGDVLDKNFE